MCFTFKKTTPCANCPYRRDAPLQLWAKEEFEDLLADNAEMAVYGCHKADKSICVGWLMMQEKNRFPSIALRIEMIRRDVGRAYLDKLHSKSSMYESVEEMAGANYEFLKNRRIQ